MADLGGISADRLRSFVERVERLEAERKGISDDVREVYSEAKGAGFDIKVMRRIIQLRKIDCNERDEMEHVLDVYMRALDMKAPLPLFVEAAE